MTDTAAEPVKPTEQEDTGDWNPPPFSRESYEEWVDAARCPPRRHRGRSRKPRVSRRVNAKLRMK